MVNLPNDVLVRIMGCSMSFCKSGPERYRQALAFMLTWRHWKVGKVSMTVDVLY
jgi:hypothetical protein